MSAASQEKQKLSCVSADFVRLKEVLTHFACSRNFRPFDVFRTRLLSKSLSSRMSLAFGLLRPNFVAGVIHLKQGIKSVHSISQFSLSAWSLDIHGGSMEAFR